jgi:hypothetical protein
MKVVVLFGVSNTETSFCAELPLSQNKLVVVIVLKRADFQFNLATEVGLERLVDLESASQLSYVFLLE